MIGGEFSGMSLVWWDWMASAKRCGCGSPHSSIAPVMLPCWISTPAVAAPPLRLLHISVTRGFFLQRRIQARVALACAAAEVLPRRAFTLDIGVRRRNIAIPPRLGSHRRLGCSPLTQLQLLWEALQSCARSHSSWLPEARHAQPQRC